MIYPVPDPELPFLGVHLTKRIDGEVLVGPTRDSGRRARRLHASPACRGRPRRHDRLARHLADGAAVLAHRHRRAAPGPAGGAFVAAARYVPDLRRGDVTGGFAGVRAQAVARDGRLVDDFVFSHTERALHVRNAPSPGATSSLAIARHIADEAQRAFGLPSPQAR